MDEVNNRSKNPILLKVISVFLFLGGVMLILNSHIMEGREVTEEMQKYLDSRTIFDKISPYLLGPLIIIASILIFLRKSKSIAFILLYIVLSTVFTLIHMMTTLWFEFNGLSGIIAVIFGFLLLLGIYFYLLHLKKKGVLN